MRPRDVLVTVALALATAGPARAGAPCLAGLDPTDAFARANVRDDVAKLHFLRPTEKDRPDCPAATPACTLPGYLVAGNEVLLKWIASPLACVHYVAPGGVATTGLVEAAKLKVRGNVMEKLTAPEILGTWAGGNATIAIAKGDGASYLLVDGDASRGAPSYNTGSIAGPAYLGGSADVAGYEDDHYRGEAPAGSAFKGGDGCRVRLRTTGTYLLVDDNDRCGGNDVSFTGIYVNARGTPRLGVRAQVRLSLGARRRTLLGVPPGSYGTHPAGILPMVHVACSPP